jgi:hypothetical protein
MVAISSERARRYLDQAFAMNPVWESARLLDLRRQTLGLSRHDNSQVAALAYEDAQLQREIVRRQVIAAQKEFWQLPIDQLQRSLSAIDVQDVPDFAPVVNRLKTAASCRGEFPKLAQLKGMDMGLFNAFKSSVVKPPADAARVKERFLQSIEDRKQLKQVQKAAKLIQREYPILYALEKDWFATLSKAKRRSSMSLEVDGAGVAEGVLGSVASIPWFGWWIILLTIKYLLIAIF